MQDSPFGQAVDFLTKSGLSVLPIAAREKFPVEKKVFAWGAAQMVPMKNWQRFSKAHASPEEIANWVTWDGIGIGVPLGELNGIVALDLDNDIDELHAQIEALVPVSPVKKRGAKGYTAFYSYDGSIPSKLSWSRNGIRVAEILSNGQQTVLPPSIHPSGAIYHWESQGLGEVGLPVLSHEHVQAIANLFPRTEIKPYIPTTPYQPKNDLPVEDMLKYLDADSYESWVQVGMSLKTEYGEAGRNLFHQFSSQSNKYNSRDTDQKFNSFKRSDRTLGSLIFEARQAGYTFPPRQEVEAVEILEGGNLRPIVHRELQRHAEDIPEHLLDAPGLIGQTMKYILDTSMFPQPVLALAASIAAVGMIMGHRARTDSDLRTNMYILAMAPSGAGKDHARKCIGKILDAIDAREHLIGSPRSDSAVISSVKNAKGRALMLADEVGRFFKMVTSAKAGTYQQNITTAMLDIYNAASEHYTGGEYANNRTQGGRADIDQPCLCIYGTSVSENVFEAFTSREAVDGFLARWLMFETNRYDIEPLERVSTPPPELLIQQFLAWQQTPTNPDPKGNLQALEIEPEVVPFTDEARDLLNRYRRECRITSDKLRKANSIGDPIWNRAAEHASKLALVAHTKGRPIDVAEVQWAIELTTNRTEYMISAIGSNVSDNAQEALLKKMLTVIKKEGKKGVSKATLTIKTPHLKRPERNELLETLLDMGRIIELEEKGTGKRPAKIYKVAGLAPEIPATD